MCLVTINDVNVMYNTQHSQHWKFQPLPFPLFDASICLKTVFNKVILFCLRVVFGPDLVMLGPDEQFTVLSLSGEKPKRANVIKAICLLLGPDFCTDIITIETADHARLQLQLAYNW